MHGLERRSGRLIVVEPPANRENKSVRVRNQPHGSLIMVPNADIVNHLVQ